MSVDVPLKEQLSAMVRKAERSLTAAETLISEGNYDFASSRAYYAAFYAIEAMLLTKELTFSKHGAVIGAFNQAFIKENIFPKEFSTFIAHLFRERQIGDYEFNMGITENEAKEDLELAGKILKAIMAYLTNNEFIG